MGCAEEPEMPNLIMYKCLRCGHSWEEAYDPADGTVELTCPKCKSNSVRRLKKKAKE